MLHARARPHRELTTLPPLEEGVHPQGEMRTPAIPVGPVTATVRRGSEAGMATAAARHGHTGLIATRRRRQPTSRGVAPPVERGGG